MHKTAHGAAMAAKHVFGAAAAASVAVLQEKMCVQASPAVAQYMPVVRTAV
jgi:hypothetical protein